MRKEMKAFIKECDCKEIQELWKPKFGDRIWLEKGKEYFHHFSEDGEYNHYKTSDGEPIILEDYFLSLAQEGGFIFLPSLSQIIEMMGDRFWTLTRNGVNDDWECTIGKGDGYKNYYGDIPELACLKGLKEILKCGTK